MNLGLERPITLVPGEKYHVVLLVDGSIATLYVDGVAMNARMYQKEGEELCLFVSGGNLFFRFCQKLNIVCQYL